MVCVGSRWVPGRGGGGRGDAGSLPVLSGVIRKEMRDFPCLGGF